MLKHELRKLFTVRLLFLLTGIALFSWGFIVYHTSPEIILVKSLSFWNTIGSLIFAFAILMVGTKIFSLDIEEQVEDVFNTTKLGKRRLFLTRLYATSIFTTFIFIILTIIQIGVIISFMQVEQSITVPGNLSFVSYFILQSATVFFSAVAFTIFTALICNMFKSHPATIIICGFLYGITYITNTAMVSKYSLHWILDKGFFSYLIKGQLFNDSTIDFIEICSLVVWYGILLTAVLLVNDKLQRRRKEI